MQNKIKSKFKSNVMSVLLTLCVSVMCFIGMSMVQRALAADCLLQQWTNRSEELPIGETHYYMVSCTPSSGSAENKYLKVVKSQVGGETTRALKVYDGNSLSEAQAASTVSTAFTGDTTYTTDTETWTVTSNDYTGIGKVNKMTDDRCMQSWGKLPAELPSGTVNYYKVSVLDSSGTPVDKYLKVVKTINSGATPPASLTVYEATIGTGSGATYDTSESNNFMAGITVADPKEEWNISLKSGSIYFNLLSVSPKCTTITSTKTWDGKESGAYVAVANETVVKFNFNDGNEGGKNFWVKKVVQSGSGSYLEISPSGDAGPWTASNYVDADGKTINARLVPVENNTADPDNPVHTPEKWEITITGYNREDADGLLIEYKVDEKDVSSAGTQHWTAGATTLAHTFNGIVNPADSTTISTFIYTLLLNDTSSSETAPNGTALLTIEKHMTGSSVTQIVVNGLTNNASDPANLVTYTTINGATYTPSGSSPVNQDPDKEGTVVLNKITFPDEQSSPTIPLSDFISASGVTVNFNIGKNNGAATLILKLTAAGKLSYAFDGLPATEYMPDPDDTANKIAVDHYSVKVTKQQP